jgi:hypothetical protein
MNTMSRWRVLAYLVGITVFVLSKGLVALALDAATSIWDLPDQIVIYWYRKGPIFLVATLLILFGFDHMLFPQCTLMGVGRRYSLRSVRLLGVVVMGVGVFLLRAALFGNAVAW